jgi:hypothetical protein
VRVVFRQQDLQIIRKSACPTYCQDAESSFPAYASLAPWFSAHELETSVEATYRYREIDQPKFLSQTVPARTVVKIVPQKYDLFA